jgi:hypothetical protein
MSLAVSNALRKLTADQRETVILKIYQGFKFEEIAEIVAAPLLAGSEAARLSQVSRPTAQGLCTQAFQ